MQHVVEADDALRMQRRRGEIEIGGECLARVIAVDVPEAHRPAERLAVMSSALRSRTFALIAT